MQIVLYRNTAEKERLDKTAYLEEVANLTGTMRAPSSVVSPIILMELSLSNLGEVTDGDGLDVADADGGELIAGANDMLIDFNYCYIPELRRYYYVSNIAIANSKLYAVSLSVDVLMSYKDEILRLSAFITRNEFEFSDMLVDNELPFEVTRSISLREMTRGGFVNMDFNVTDNSVFGVRHYVLSLINTFSSQALESVPPVSGTSLPRIDSYRWSLAGSSVYVYEMDRNNVRKLLDKLKANEDLIPYVAAAIAFPFDLPRGEEDTFWGYGDVYLAGNTYSDVQSNRWGYGSLSGYWIVADETFPEIESFKDCNPYSSIEFYLPYYGFTDIDPRTIARKRIIVYYTCNMTSGEGSVNIYNVTDDAPLFTAQCVLGQEVGITRSNIQELNRLRASNAINTALGLISSTISIAAGAATGNAVAVAGGILSAGKTIAGAVTTEMNAIPRSSVNVPSTLAGTHQRQRVLIKETRMIPNPIDGDAYAHAKGKPLNSMRVLSACHGFTIGENIHLDGVSAYESEASEIKAFIETGVILP